MAIHDTTKSPADQREVLAGCIRARGLGHFALFFVSDSGTRTPDGYAAVDGYVLADDGRVFSFTFDWDPELQHTCLTEWIPTEPEPDWIEEPEYVRARAKVGPRV